MNLTGTVALITGGVQGLGRAMSEKLLIDGAKTFRDAKSTFGSLDIVCNNAGITTRNPKDARKIVDINLTAVLEGTYHAIELMSKKHGGNGGLVVNIASAAGFDISVAAPMYTATKQGVVGFTRVFKRENILKEHGVRINCICPFFCETEMLTNALKIAPPEAVKMAKSVELIKKEDVVEAFMQCEVVAIFPGPRIFNVNFPVNQQTM